MHVKIPEKGPSLQKKNIIFHQSSVKNSQKIIPKISELDQRPPYPPDVAR